VGCGQVEVAHDIARTWTQLQAKRQEGVVRSDPPVQSPVRRGARGRVCNKHSIQFNSIQFLYLTSLHIWSDLRQINSKKQNIITKLPHACTHSHTCWVLIIAHVKTLSMIMNIWYYVMLKSPRNRQLCLTVFIFWDISLYTSICVPARLPVCLSLCLPLCLSLCVSLCPLVCLSICLSLCLFLDYLHPIVE
jgi:hypothetical protein